MRTRPDVQQETLSRRLALVRPEPGGSVPEESDPEESAWWTAHAGGPGWQEAAFGGRAPDDPVPDQREVGGTLVPEPGRHAARRSLLQVPRLPEALQGRAMLGTGQLAVVALVLVAALALTCWWLARGRASDLAPVAAPTDAPSALVSLAADPGTGAATPAAVVADASAGAAGAAGSVTVDVEGKVRRPGIVVLPTGSRVTDALKEAGGVPRRAALHGLNLAAVLTDGQQIVVGASPAAVVDSSGLAAAGGEAPAGALVDLNTADAEQLDTLPGVGPVTAQSILEWREQNGGFTSVQELLEVDGIGPPTIC